MLAGAVISVSGLVILQLGSYFRADSHSRVFNSLTHKVVATFLDVCVTVTVFALGFVMMAGAGSTMAQQFGWPVWLGSAIMLVLVLLTGLLDVNRVTQVIGYVTPVVIVAIAAAFVFALLQLPVDLGALDQLARSEPSPISPWWLSAINYAGLVLLTALLLMLSTGLLLSFDQVIGVSVPTLAMINSIHPILGQVMVWIIYVMIYSTCIGQYYSLGRRLTAARPRRFYPVFAASAVIGFGISFVGFEALMASVYPALGYLGLVLAAVMAVGYLREWPNIDAESTRRVAIRALFTRRMHPAQTYTRSDAEELAKLVEESPMTARDMREAITEEVLDELTADDTVDFERDDEPVEPLTAEEIAALPEDEADETGTGQGRIH